MSKHLKRLNSPKVLKIHKKEKKWTIKTSPGPHPIKQSISLGILLRDYFNLCDNYKEAKRIISNGDVLVDGVQRKNHKFSCGLMDVISIPKMKKDFRILFNQKGKLIPIPIKSKDSTWKLCRIENKKIVKGGLIQLNLHDGKNKIVKKKEYKKGDVLKISFKDQKIDEVYSFDKGNISMIIGGKHIGQKANIQDIEIIKSSKPNISKMKGTSEFTTIQDYVFPIGKNKPIIDISEVEN